MQSGERLRAAYEFKKVDHLVRAEFYIWDEAVARWMKEGMTAADIWENNIFGYDVPPAKTGVSLGLGWCEAPFLPEYEKKTIRCEGEHEIIQDMAGRWLKVFKGRLNGFMPDYIRHPLVTMKDWEEEVKPRLDYADPRRYKDLEKNSAEAKKLAKEEGRMITVGFIGGYMYLRSLMGPEETLVAFYDKPEVVRAAMEHWCKFMDYSLEKIQKYTEIDTIEMAEDICYKAGLLISPDMMREFLIPYYQQVVNNARKRQNKRIFYFVDTDGWAEPSVPVYSEVGLDGMGPWEVASGCDVVEIGKKYPKLTLFGGIDKRILAKGKEAIDAHLKHIMPFMVKRGGYCPTCDHGVPNDVSYENYTYFRKRLYEMDH